MAEITYSIENVERMLREYGKKAAENERGEILTLLDQLVEVSKIARNSWPAHCEQWFDCNNRYQAYQNAYLRVKARDRQE
jgi:hypothetical protein